MSIEKIPFFWHRNFNISKNYTFKIKRFSLGKGYSFNVKLKFLRWVDVPLSILAIPIYIVRTTLGISIDNRDIGNFIRRGKLERKQAIVQIPVICEKSARSNIPLRTRRQYNYSTIKRTGTQTSLYSPSSSERDAFTVAIVPLWESSF